MDFEVAPARAASPSCSAPRRRRRGAAAGRRRRACVQPRRGARGERPARRRSRLPARARARPGPRRRLPQSRRAAVREPGAATRRSRSTTRPCAASPDEALLHFNRAIALEDLGRADEALGELRTLACGSRPTSPTRTTTPPGCTSSSATRRRRCATSAPIGGCSAAAEHRAVAEAQAYRAGVMGGYGSGESRCRRHGRSARAGIIDGDGCIRGERGADAGGHAAHRRRPLAMSRYASRRARRRRAVAGRAGDRRSALRRGNRDRIRAGAPGRPLRHPRQLCRGHPRTDDRPRGTDEEPAGAAQTLEPPGADEADVQRRSAAARARAAASAYRPYGPMSRFFEPLQIGALRLANRIVIAPMCQYRRAKARRATGT